MSSRILASVVLMMSSAQVFAQSQPNQFDDVGKEVIAKVTSLQREFSYKVESASACFPEYKGALEKIQNQVGLSTKNFQEGIAKDKAKLEEIVGKEVTELNAIKKLLDKEPQNGAYQKLYKDKKERVDIALNKAKEDFTKSYHSRVDAFVHTFPLEKTTFSLSNVKIDDKYLKKNYWVLEKQNLRGPFKESSPGQGITDKYVAADKDSDAHKKNKVFEKYSKNILSPEWEEQALTSYSSPTYYSFRGMEYYYGLSLGSNSDVLNKESNLYKDCKTAGCVYLLNEQLKSFLLSLESIDMSLTFNKPPLNLSISDKGVVTPPNKINLVMDHLGSLSAKKLPIGNIVPSCDEEKLSKQNVNKSLTRSNEKEEHSSISTSEKKGSSQAVEQ